MTDIPRVLIAEPIYLGLPPKVYQNRIRFWIQCTMDKLAGKYRFNQMTIGPRENIRAARYKAILEAVQSDATHVLFFDDDVLVPFDIISRLLHVDADVVGGLMNKDDGSPIVFRSTCTFSEETWFDHPKTEAFKCAAVGAGCMLIRTSILRKLQLDNGTGKHWIFNYDDTRRSMDVLFCRHVHNVGGSVWCLPEPKCEQIPHY